MLLWCLPEDPEEVEKVLRIGRLNMQKYDPKLIIQAYAVNAMAPLLLCSYVFDQMKNQK